MKNVDNLGILITISNSTQYTWNMAILMRRSAGSIHYSLSALSYGLDFLFNFLHLGGLTWDWQKEEWKSKTLILSVSSSMLVMVEVVKMVKMAKKIDHFDIVTLWHCDIVTMWPTTSSHCSSPSEVKIVVLIVLGPLPFTYVVIFDFLSLFSLNRLDAFLFWIKAVFPDWLALGSRASWGTW